MVLLRICKRCWLGLVFALCFWQTLAMRQEGHPLGKVHSLSEA